MMREPNKSEVSLLTEENRGMCRKEIDSRWSWLVCVCATVMIALMFGISLNFGVLFPVLMDYFQESRERTGNFMEETINNFFMCDDSVFTLLDVFSTKFYVRVPWLKFRYVSF